MEKIIDRPVLASMFFIIIIILGIYSLNSLMGTQIELVPDPEERLPSLTVTYYWRGMPPDIILQKVLLPAEEEIMEIKGIAKIESTSRQNFGRISVEFNRNTNMDFALLTLSERLNRLQRESGLPRQVATPLIQSDVPDEFETEPLLNVGVYGKFSIYGLKRVIEREIVPYLKSIPGIESVHVWGGVDPEIKIKTDKEKLDRFNIGIFDIYTKISQYFYSLQSISMRRSSEEITLSLTESPDRIQDIRDIVITNTGEKRIFLKEVADIYLGYEKLRWEQRYQGKSVVGLRMFKQANTSSLNLAERVKEKLRFLANKLKGQVEFVIQEDESQELRDRLLKLIRIAFLILIIIFIILLVIVKDIKASLLIFASVFFSVFATFTAIYLLRIPFNLLTLSGLALGFGLFVDNAVVVFDSILRHREKGFDNRESSIKGANSVFLPVLSSTITTIIVFFSFAYFDGRLRMYYLPLAYVIAISLVSSIIVSFILIPSLSLRINIKFKKRDVLFRKGRFFPFILKYPLAIILPIIFIFLHSYNVFKEEVSFGQFFSWYSRERLDVRLGFPSGAEFEDIKKAILKFENLALSKPYKKEINTYISEIRRGARMVVTFPEEVEFSAFPYQLKQELTGLATNLAGIAVYVSGFDPENYWYNPDTGSFLPYTIQIKGYNFEKLMEYTGELKRSMLNHRRIKDIEIQTDMNIFYGAKEKYFAFKLDREKLKTYRLTPRYLLGLISTMLIEQTSIQRLRFHDKEMAVEIKISDVEDLELDDILNMHLVTVEGIPFRIRDLVEIELTTQKGGITRENQEYVAMVRWDYLGSNKAGDRYHKTLFKNLKIPVGFTKSLEERRLRLTEEEEAQLYFAIYLSIFLIYLILGILYENFFQPLLIMLSIPLALIGVFMAFVIMDYSFDSTAYIGVILLSGIVVNNAILLIDNINRHLAQTNEIVASIIIGTKERIRPIFMTSTTTVLGMLPLIIFRRAETTDIWSSLALCTVGGLTTSALLILFVLPIFYYLFYRLQKFLFAQKTPETQSQSAS